MKLKKKKKSIFTNWLLLVKMLISKITYFWPSLNPCALIALRHFVVKNDIANIMQRPKNLYFFLVQSLHTVLWQTNIFCKKFPKNKPPSNNIFAFLTKFLELNVSIIFKELSLSFDLTSFFLTNCNIFSFFKPTVLLVRFTIKPSVMHYVHYMQIYSSTAHTW